MRAWVLLLAVLSVPVYCRPAFPQPSSGESRLAPSMAHPDAEALATLHSDEEARRFFSTRLRHALDLNAISVDFSSGPPGKSKTSQAPLPSPEWMELGGRLTAELAARQLAHRLKQAASDGDPTHLPVVLDQTRSQHLWLLEGNARPELSRAVRLAAVLSDFSASDSRAITPVLIELYDHYLDRAYPEFIDTEKSWVTLAEQAGAAGIRQRLMEFWNGHANAQTSVSAAEQQAVASHYVYTRLRPIFLSQVTASAIRAEVTADEQAHGYWIRLKAWPDQVREAKGLARLCGTWQWTIHNHRHHQDQKVAMVFPPPDADSFTGARPAKTVILGDAIYLRWEFPGIVQEDSLLFTGEGQRVEGSFVNSSGAWGSITGKRIAACGR